MESDIIIDLKGIRFAYPLGPPVLQGLDFTFRAGDRIGLAAPNGSGKTTLFQIIMGLLTPLAGSVTIFGRERREEADFREVRRRIGLLFQDADDQLFSPTVLDDVAFGPLNLGQSRADAAAKARETLAYLGLADFEQRITYKLSGGEKRLVALATVLAMEPEVLLLDEPSTGLDEATKQKLIEILNSLGLSFILISHEFDFLSQTATQFYTLDQGRILLEAELHPHTHEHMHQLGKRPHSHKS